MWVVVMRVALILVLVKAAIITTIASSHLPPSKSIRTRLLTTAEENDPVVAVQ